jgi:hypothetical protein
MSATGSDSLSTGPLDARAIVLRGLGAVIAYGCLAAFLCLVSVQVYRWLRDGEWTHIGITDGLRAVLVNCCVRDEDSGLGARIVHWIDTPTDWFGWHKILEVVPATIGLFTLSILGNFLFVYGTDRLQSPRPERTGS